MDLVVGMESHSKEVEAGWANEKQLLLGYSVANSRLPQQHLPEALREGKSQSWEREGTGKQRWRSQNSFAHGNLLIAMAGSCCAQRFQGGGSWSATFPPRSPAFPLRHCCTGTFRQQMGSPRPGWQHRAASGAGVRSRPLQVQGYGPCICHARLHAPTLQALSYAGPIFPHLCCLFILSAFAQWEHPPEMQRCTAISTGISGTAGTRLPGRQRGEGFSPVGRG